MEVLDGARRATNAGRGGTRTVGYHGNSVSVNIRHKDLALGGVVGCTEGTRSCWQRHGSDDGVRAVGYHGDSIRAIIGHEDLAPGGVVGYTDGTRKHW